MDNLKNKRLIKIENFEMMAKSQGYSSLDEMISFYLKNIILLIDFQK